MHLLNALPQRLDPGATPTFAGLISASLAAPASTNLTLAGGSSGASLVLEQGSSGVPVFTTTNEYSLGTLTTTSTQTGVGNIPVFQFRNSNSTVNNGVALRFSSVDTGSTYRSGTEMGTIFTARTASTISAALYFATSNAGALTERMRIAANGDVNIVSTTAGASNAGALVVAGGISAGNTGSAASYFGGNVSIGGPAKATLVIDSADGATNGSAVAFVSDGSYKWIVKAASFTDGSLFTIGTATGVFTSTPVLSLNYSTAAATFAGAVTANGNLTASGTSNLFSGASAISNARNLFRGAAGSAAVYLSDADTPGATSPSLYFASSTDGMFLRNASGVLQVIDETTPAAGDGSVRFQVSNAGAVRMNAYGAGAATFDSSGNITSVSDARLKNITGTFTKGLAEIVKLTPKLYTWKPETGLVTDDINATLIAQDLIAAGLSEAVTTYRTVPVMEDDVQSAEDIAAGKPVTQHAKLDADGKAVTQRVDSNYSVSDRTVIAALVNAVKELKAEIDALKAK